MGATKKLGKPIPMLMPPCAWAEGDAPTANTAAAIIANLIARRAIRLTRNMCIRSSLPPLSLSKHMRGEIGYYRGHAKRQIWDIVSWLCGTSKMPAVRH